MPAPASTTTEATATRARRRLLGAGLAMWGVLLGFFWFYAQGSPDGAVGTLIRMLEGLAHHPWAAVGVLLLYLLRPLLLLPITVINLTSGFVLGFAAGLPLALVGTLASATIGYAIGWTLSLARRSAPIRTGSGLLQTLQQHGFASVAAGGLMYLHADAVNLPAGMLRIRYPLFIAGITVGNSLTMTSAVLAGASAQGLSEASVPWQPQVFALALVLFALSLLLAYLLRRHTRNRERRRERLAS